MEILFKDNASLALLHAGRVPVAAWLEHQISVVDAIYYIIFFALI